jgi:uncharacterized protein (DUF1697 family)
MTKYVALLRAVNVGGTGKLPMAELKSMCSDAGFARVETYIASGNVVFETKARPSRVKAELEARLLAFFANCGADGSGDGGSPQGQSLPGSRAQIHLCHFPRRAAPLDALDHAVGQSGERMALGDREIFVHYGKGMGRSKLRIPAARTGTARNMNTVAKLAEIASKP